MADKIRGITIEIGGDSTGLTKALKDTNSEIKDTQKQLKDVERLLKLDPTNIDLLRQREKLLTDSVSETSTKLDELKKLQETMDQNGIDKNSEQYMALQREIASTEDSLKKLETAAGKSNAVLSEISAVADKVAEGAQKVADKTAAMSTAAGGALAALGGLAYKAVTNADELSTMAKQTGFTTDTLQKAAYAADLIDVSYETFTGSITKLTGKLRTSEKSFAELGIATRDAGGNMLSTEEIFWNSVDALSRIQNETERDIAAQQLFGKSAADLAGIIDDGGAAFRDLGQEAENAGLILSGETLDSLNETNDKIDRLKATASATMGETGAKAAEVLLPVIEKVMGAINQLLTWLGSLDQGQLQTIMTVLAVIAAISPVAGIISKIASAVSFITTTVIPGLSAAITFLMANPIVLLIAGIVALVTLIATKGDEIQAILQKVDDFLQNIFSTDFTNIFGPVLGEAMNGFMQNLKNIWDSIKQVLDGIIDFIRGVFTGDWKRAWNGVKEIFGGIFSGLGALLKAPINGVISLINAAINGINSLIDNINNGVGAALGFSIGHIGNLAYLAKGGVLSAGSAIVGERGPELLTMQGTKAVVQPLTGGKGNTSAPGKAAASVQPVLITVQSILDGRVIAESTTRYQQQKEKAYGA